MYRFIELLRSLREGEVARDEIDVRIAPLIGDPGFDRQAALTFMLQEDIADWLDPGDRERIRALLTGEDAVPDATVMIPARPDDAPEQGAAPRDAGAGEPDPETTVIGRADEMAGRSSVTVGDTVKGRFILESHLGSGGMGDVFRALDLRKEEARDRDPYVAIKILNPEFRLRPESLMTLQREARRAQGLAHPNIVRVYDFDRDDNLVYLTMEFLNGSPLDHLTRATGFAGLARDQAVALIRQLGDALAFAHENGVAHCDLKPGNIFLTEDRQIKVIDFGISRPVTTGNDHDVTRFDPAVLGALTPAYASPEVIEGSVPDIASDIFAFGCIAYELLTGKHPFNRIEATKARDSGLSPVFPDFLNSNQVAALAGALQFNPARRIASIRAFLDLFVTTQAAPRRNRVAIAAAAGLVAALAGVGYLLLDNLSAPTPPPTQTASTPDTPAAPVTDSGIVTSTDLAKILAQPAPTPDLIAQSSDEPANITRGDAPGKVAARPPPSLSPPPATAPVPDPPSLRPVPDAAQAPRQELPADPAVKPEPDPEPALTETPVAETAPREPAGQTRPVREPKIAALPRPSVTAPDLAAVRKRLTGLDCAVLQSAVLAGTVSLKGYVYDSAVLGPVTREIRGLPGVTDVRVSARPMSKFQCGVMQFLEPHLRFNRGTGYGLDIRFRGTGGEYREGEKLIVDLRAPADPAYVQVDYFTTDGSVVHIFPDAKAAGDKVPANLRIGIGDAAYSMDFPVGPPFGVEMVLAVASTVRLIPPRSEIVENATEYLKLLFTAMQQRQAGGAPVAADILFATTMAK